MADQDAELVALIDNELDEDAKARLIFRLKGDEALRERYEALREAGAPIAASLQALLEKAPVPRLRAALPREDAGRAASRPFAGIDFRQIAAGFVVGLLAAGVAAWVAMSSAPDVEREDWRAAVIEYMDLYNNDTFAVLNPDASLQGKELSAVGAKVGADLTPESVMLPGLRFKAAQLLSYEGSPLGEVAFADAQGAPVLFCVIANGGPDAPMRSERRGEYRLSTWSRGGRGYLVIGRLPEEQVADLARTLEKRL
jgi:anti-sigma factor RsiW